MPFLPRIQCKWHVLTNGLANLFLTLVAPLVTLATIQTRSKQGRISTLLFCLMSEATNEHSEVSLTGRGLWT